MSIRDNETVNKKQFITSIYGLINKYWNTGEFDRKEAFRLAHNIKSTYSFAGQNKLAEQAHNLETFLNNIGAVPINDDYVIKVKKQIDDLQSLAYFESSHSKSSDEFEDKLLKESIYRGETLFRIRFTIDPFEIMPYARAFLVVNILEQNMQIIRIEPSIAIHNQSRTYDIYATTKYVSNHIKSLIDVDNIASIDITSLPYTSLTSPYEADVFDVLINNDSYDSNANKIKYLQRQYHFFIISKLRKEKRLDHAYRIFTKSIDNLTNITVNEFFSKYQNRIKDLADHLGKRVILNVENGKLELNQSVLSELDIVFIHLIRNSLAHGIEYAEQRRESGKPQIATISINIEIKNNRLVINYKDDGKGIDRAKIKALASQNIKDNDDKSLIDLISIPGLSTQNEVNSMAGRGLGIEIIRNTIEQKLQGTINVQSLLQKGTEFSIEIPYAFDSEEYLIVNVNKTLMAIPTISIEVYGPLSDMLEIYSQEELPLYKSTMMIDRNTEENTLALICWYGNKKAILLCDEILYKESIDWGEFSLTSTGQSYLYYFEKQGYVKDYLYLDLAFI
ncbi:ATP-binding protein [Spirochaeta cellobiosiphila]|uniref:ATP-binding protein n=1 Tax=Spirochaeta cellobiosiphila TaxID=504483 RepID=UPI0004246986|nr:ATP-binding protein [Spirochaeta cellobiosiphila]